MLGDVLGDVHARGAVLWRADRTPPWAWVSDEAAPLTLYAVLRGSAVITAEGAPPAELAVGDTALVRGPRPHTVSDDGRTPPQVRVHASRHCTPLHGAATPEHPGGEAPSTVVVAGAYQARDEIGGRLLDVLPPLLTVPAAEAASEAEPSALRLRGLLKLLGEEIDVPGAAGRRERRADLDRLLDLVLVRTLTAWFERRAWSERGEAAVPGWFGALADPIAGPALRAAHADPAHPWTAEGLAALAGVSRATLYRRFTDLVGEPPLTYLTGLRMSLAAELLRDPRATVESVARRVGYRDPFAFSTAFRRAHGHSPSTRQRTGEQRTGEQQAGEQQTEAPQPPQPSQPPQPTQSTPPNAAQSFG